MNQIKSIIKPSIIIILIILTSLFAGCIDSSQDNNEYANDFTFNYLNGGKKHTSDYAGKIVLIDFTGVNCPWCVPQTFVLEEIHNNYNSDDLVIISIYVWMVLGETVQDIYNLIEAYNCSSPCEAEDNFSQMSLKRFKEDFNKKDGLELNWVLGYDNQEGTLYNKYGKKGIPFLLLLDKKGNIYYSFNGLTDYSSITDKLDELIG